MSVVTELAGLAAAITSATTGAISRSVTVRDRDLDGFYTGTYPLIIIRPSDMTQVRIAGGQTGLKGQQGNSQNYYSFEIRDVINPRDTGTERVAASQTDLYTLYEAIRAWFDHLPAQSLPVGGYPQAYKAGEFIRSRIARPFTTEDGGEVNVAIVGLISVIGIPVSQSAT